MQVNRDLIHRWLSAIAHSPVPRRPLLIATALTAAAAVAAGAGATAPGGTDGVARIRTVSAADAATPVADGGTAASAGGFAGKNDRAAKIAAAREKASQRKAATAAPEPAGNAGKAGKNDRAAKIAAARQKASQRKGGAAAPQPAGNAGNADENDRAAKIAAARDQASGGKPDRPAAKGGPAAKGDRPAKKSVPSERDLMPNGKPGGQSAFQPSGEQVANAESIVRTGERMKMPPRAQVIAVATALQESKLQNLGHLGAINDHDSLGLFQQRPSVGWGTPEQVTDPDYAAEQFYRGLQRVPGYTGIPLTQAAQTVQVSAFPDAYAQWEKMAADLVLAAHGAGPYAGIADGK